MASQPPAAPRLDQVDPDWAWRTYVPSAAYPWNLERAAHLYRRATCGGRWSELETALKAGPAATVDRLLAGEPGGDAFDRETARTIAPLLTTGNAESLPPWWLHVMLHTPRPLRERITLFWHGHFATSAAKVTDPKLMYGQNVTLRRHALGRFADLLNALVKDPAMIVWLDAASNRRLHPNENLAREVMELFSLGVGHYSEHDIKEAARALTGWEVRDGVARFNPRQHDEGSKTVLGQTGAWNADDLVRILLAQPAAGQFIARKLFRYLVNDEELAPPAPLIEALAADYRRHDYDTARLVRTILASNIFYSEHALRRKIKGPVEFAIGLVRALEGSANVNALAADLVKLGQGVFFPPNVKGWDGGREWINSATLLGRANLAWAMLHGDDDRYKRKIPLESLAARRSGSPAETVRGLVELLIGGPLPDAVVVQLTTMSGGESSHRQLARVIHAITTLPEFQLA